MDVSFDMPVRGDAQAATDAAPASAAAAPAADVLQPWLRAQAINVTRHAAALRPFRGGEFGRDDAARSEGHLQAVNALITSLREGLLAMTRSVGVAARIAAGEPTAAHLQATMVRKARAHDWVRGIEKI